MISPEDDTERSNVSLLERGESSACFAPSSPFPQGKVTLLQNAKPHDGHDNSEEDEEREEKVIPKQRTVSNKPSDLSPAPSISSESFARFMRDQIALQWDGPSAWFLRDDNIKAIEASDEMLDEDEQLDDELLFKGESTLSQPTKTCPSDPSTDCRLPELNHQHQHHHRRSSTSTSLVGNLPLDLLKTEVSAPSEPPVIHRLGTSMFENARGAAHLEPTSSFDAARPGMVKSSEHSRCNPRAYAARRFFRPSRQTSPIRFLPPDLRGSASFDTMSTHPPSSSQAMTGRGHSSSFSSESADSADKLPQKVDSSESELKSGCDPLHSMTSQDASSSTGSSARHQQYQDGYVSGKQPPLSAFVGAWAGDQPTGNSSTRNQASWASTRGLPVTRSSSGRAAAEQRKMRAFTDVKPNDRSSSQSRINASIPPRDRVRHSTGSVPSMSFPSSSRRVSRRSAKSAGLVRGPSDSFHHKDFSMTKSTTTGTATNTTPTELHANREVRRNSGSARRKSDTSAFSNISMIGMGDQSVTSGLSDSSRAPEALYPSMLEMGGDIEESSSAIIDDSETGPGAFAVGRDRSVRYRMSAVDESNYTQVTSSLHGSSEVRRQEMARFLSQCSACDSEATMGSPEPRGDSAPATSPAAEPLNGRDTSSTNAANHHEPVILESQDVQVETSDDKPLKTRRKSFVIIACILVLLAILLPVSLFAGGNGNEESENDFPLEPGTPTAQPLPSPTSIERLHNFMQRASVLSSMDDLTKAGTPQHSAVKWLANVDPAMLDPEDWSVSEDVLMERYVATLFYFSLNLNGATAIRPHWLTGESICHWNSNDNQGIICNKDGSIQEISVRFFMTGGNLPSELCSLTSLRKLDLSRMALQGSFPTSLLDCTNLKTLDLTSNSLAGTIPDLSGLSSLSLLGLGSNRLSGVIPFESFPDSLESLVLSGNRLTGSISANISKLSGLKTLFLTSNADIESTIPTEIGLLTDMQQLVMDQCNLSGTIPSQIGLLNNLIALRLNSNILQGRIPSEIGLLMNLQDLMLYRNMLNGVLPSELARLESLRRLDVRFNGDLNGSLNSLCDVRQDALTQACIDNPSFIECICCEEGARCRS